MRRRFNWDNYCEHAKFTDVKSLAFGLSIRPVPSMYSPDKKLLYLSSLDLDVSLASRSELLMILQKLEEEFARLHYLVFSQGGNLYSELATCRKDFIEVCSVLYSIDPDNIPDGVVDPDFYLKEAINCSK